MCQYCFSDNVELGYGNEDLVYCFDCDHEHKPEDTIEDDCIDGDYPSPYDPPSQSDYDTFCHCEDNPCCGCN